jgi:glycosyltransferase involved in cell wall biosynthesis
MSDRRVLHVNRVAYLGGVERVILNLGTGLQPHGYESLLACPENGELPKAARDRGIVVTPCDFDRMRITANLSVMARYPIVWYRSSQQMLHHCSTHKINILHCHHPVGVLYSIRASRTLGIPIILHVHEILPAKPFYALALRVAVRYAQRFICVSGASKELLETAKPDPATVRVIHNGVDPSFPSADSVAPVPELSGPGPHIGVFGVIEPRKGQHVFLQAAAQLAKDFPTAHFWIVGPLALADKADYLKTLEQLAAEPSLVGRVHFPGFQYNVASWMKGMDVVTLTSVAHESLPMVLIEALMLGRPVIASLVGGTHEIVSARETGLLVPPGDPGALAQALRTVLNGAASAFSTRGMADAHQRFTSDVFCRRIAEVYNETIQSMP